jgi:hypothetical protein
MTGMLQKPSQQYKPLTHSIFITIFNEHLKDLKLSWLHTEQSTGNTTQVLISHTSPENWGGGGNYTEGLSQDRVVTTFSQLSISHNADNSKITYECTICISPPKEC